MFTITKKLLITATVASPLAFLPTSASAFGLGGMHHGGMSQHLGGMNRMGGMMRNMGNLNRIGNLGRMGNLGGMKNLNRLGDLRGKTNMVRGMNSARMAGSHLHQAAKAADKVAAHDFDRSSHRHEEHSHAHTHRVHDGIYIDDVPGLTPPIFVDDQPRFSGRPVIAEGNGTKTTTTANAPGGNADTPDQIVKVANPCDGAILKVTTARSTCVNGVVQISGNQYYYCPSKNEFQVRSYSYTPVPEIKCDGTGQISTSSYSIPRGWDTTRDPKVHACVDTGNTVIQWVAGPQFWEQVTWHVFKCFDENGQEVMRLFPDPDVKVSTTSSSDPEPITANDLRK